ncbi:S-adenosylmethionine--tRNA ribosyltransferase-isomerase [Chthonomonas calidirosea]|uniref:S-adenosylmethionine:tRNA ribosyltransferase-isomerase n=2 Tax=Chthonomonas TaxID=1077265 RepID=S0EVY9_CHTCT|nr:tRNA preQ1(34) S-adenosylmethionine ribosyltransferase-isomerase QueA [Chthonomonas calidirosea]CCW35990.1 S-adenosylmethionine--tRNAribosyltransferase-isomerase [Chthonomonas calidirosea T49]CEK18653.1 S-adenosylmethionine--tRNA ribosyltransferase-isomerase [Chthonomonas calidirosea]
MNAMRTELFDYELPPHLIAQTPLPRGESRLLVLHRKEERIEHRKFSDLPDYLVEGDVLVLNDTRVSARRVQAQRENGKPAEVLLLRPVAETDWEALVHPGLKPGRKLTLIGPNDDRVEAIVVGVTPEGGRLLSLPNREWRDRIASWGEIPLPPYIHQSVEDEERYQTVYGHRPGSAAAPTAGLHFNEALLDALARKGVKRVELTLHISVDTFRPVREENVEEHKMHGEQVMLSEEAAQVINQASGRIVAVGTTCVRALETAAQHARPGQRVAPFQGETHLFITPGYTFRAVDALITNFHLPKSTLLMLVSAFAGRELVLRAYREAVEKEYRFYSFGDAMLIL